jgi:hypothetical protein
MTVGKRRTTKGPSGATSEHSLRRKAEKICRQQKVIPPKSLGLPEYPACPDGQAQYPEILTAAQIFAGKVTASRRNSSFPAEQEAGNAVLSRIDGYPQKPFPVSPVGEYL